VDAQRSPPHILPLLHHANFASAPCTSTRRLYSLSATTVEPPLCHLTGPKGVPQHHAPPAPPLSDHSFTVEDPESEPPPEILIRLSSPTSKTLHVEPLTLPYPNSGPPSPGLAPHPPDPQPLAASQGDSPIFGFEPKVWVGPNLILSDRVPVAAAQWHSANLHFTLRFIRIQFKT
jgi:hypothetical protein